MKAAYQSKNSKEGLYNLVYTTEEELSKYSSAIDDMYNGDLAGLIIKNYIDSEQIKKYIGSFGKYKHLEKETDIGREVGPALWYSGPTLNEYFAKSASLIELQEAVFGENMMHKLAVLFESIGSGRPATVPSEGPGKDYCPYHLRCFYPRKGGLKCHADNLFLVDGSKGLDYMLESFNLYNYISFFILLQSPEIGGKLVLFDLLWEDSPEYHTKRFNNREDDSEFQKFDFEIAKLSPGDLIVFNGGRIWHKVTEIEGKISRYTLGGFAATTKDNSRIGFWS